MFYVNPGYAELLGADSQYFTTVKDNTYSNNGVSFVKTINTEVVRTYGLESGKDYYVKICWYQKPSYRATFQIKISSLTYRTSTSNSSSAEIYLQIGSTVSFRASRKQSDSSSYSIINAPWSDEPLSNFSNPVSQTNSLWFAFQPSVSRVRLYINSLKGAIQFRTSGEYPVWQLPLVFKMEISFSSTKTGVGGAGTPYFSNFIVSDQYIPPEAEIAIVPPSDIDTDMASLEGGKYRIDGNDQQLLMTPNMTDLLDTYSKSSQVYAIAPAGCPSEQSGSGELTLTGISQLGDTTTDHNSISAASIGEGFTIPWQAAEDMTLNDLNKEQYGFKTS